MKNTTNLFAWILGLFYIISSIGKSIDYQAFAHLLNQYSIPPFLGYILVGIEMVVGLSLISTTKRRVPSVVSMGMLLTFSIIYAYGSLVLGVKDCGCFGKFDFLNSTSLVGLLTRNIILFALSYFLFRNKDISVTYTFKQVYTSYFLAAIVVGALGFTPNGQEELIGKSPTLVGISLDSLKKDHILFVFSPTCSHCRKSTVKVKQEFSVNHNITGLTFSGQETEIQSYKDSLKVTFPIATAEKPRLRKYFKTIPKFVYIHDGIITSITDSLKVN
jgi:uncharacterized membrane protein YphA (DoxX/SURF4 family)